MYKNKVSKYKNKLNQVGGSCPFKNGDIVIRKDDNSKYGTVVGLILNERLQTCTKLYVKLENEEVDIWNSMDVEKIDTDNLDQLANTLSITNILSTMSLPDIIKLYRTRHPEIKNAIKVYKKYDFYDQDPLQEDIGLREFNEMFPFCKGLNISYRRNIPDADFIYLRGIKRLNISGWIQITDIALVHLCGIHTLNLRYGYQPTRITNATLVNLRGIHTLNIDNWEQIRDVAFVNLRGIHTLSMDSCDQITDTAFINLRGIHSLFMVECNQPTITDAAFVHLHGINTLNMQFCNQVSITNIAFDNLHGIKKLNMFACNPERIVYALSIGLPVTK